MDKSTEYFKKSLEERHNSYIRSVDTLIPALVSENKDLKTKESQNCLDTANKLQDLLAINDRPSWLTSSISVLNYYGVGTYNTHQLMKFFIDNYQAIKSHKWNFNQSDFERFEFDEIFRKSRDEGTLEELLEKVIEIFQQILDSGEIDSIKLKESLEKMISMIQNNKNGSYFSLNSMWVIVVTFIKEYLFAEFSSLPIVGSLAVALRETVENIDEEMMKVNENAKNKMQSIIHSEFNVLKDKKSSIPFLTYSKEGLIADKGDEKKIIDVDA
jgi:Mor family transcriptional regulator